jgi:hypothetical protein
VRTLARVRSTKPAAPISKAGGHGKPFHVGDVEEGTNRDAVSLELDDDDPGLLHGCIFRMAHFMDLAVREMYGERLKRPSLKQVAEEFCVHHSIIAKGGWHT